MHQASNGGRVGRESVVSWCDRINATLLQVKGKVNALSVDSCQRLGVVFEDLVSACELINSSRVQVQVTGVVPTIAIDKCDGVQVGTPHGPCCIRLILMSCASDPMFPGFSAQHACKGCVVLPALTAAD